MMPGTECVCKDAYAGHVVWRGPNSYGKCEPAKCDIKGSNRLAGQSCACKQGFDGDIQWNGDRVSGSCYQHCDGPGVALDETSMTCYKLPCKVLNSNQEPGPHCRCKDGFAGQIDWTDLASPGSCLPAACGIAHTRGDGLDCVCEDGYSGTILWKEAKPSGFCSHASCSTIKHAVGSGPDLRCSIGFQGHLMWAGDTCSGTCVAKTCHADGVTGEGPGIRCADGYEGTATWNSDNQCDAQCKLSCVRHWYWLWLNC